MLTSMAHTLLRTVLVSVDRVTTQGRADVLNSCAGRVLTPEAVLMSMISAAV